MKIVINYR